MTTNPIRSVLVAATAVTALAVSACTAAAQDPAPPGQFPGLGEVIGVSGGELRGTVGDGVNRYRGVPYAAPPVGELRFAPPQPASSWNGVRDATGPGPICAQGGVYGAPVSGQEDCLYVDITAPNTPSDTPRPVFVWLHGGGLSVGEGSEIDPSRMARLGDVVVVTVEFRLASLGLMALPGLDGSGTALLADQQAALRWVRDEIAAFGGDPERVTLGGESGGSIATCGQLTSPGVDGLIQRAVLQSGECSATFPPNTLAPGTPGGSFFAPLADVEALGVAAADRLGCAGPDALACLRDLPVDRVLAEGAALGSAAYGTPLLPRRPADALRDGEFARVPVLSGHTRDEGTLQAQTFEIFGTPITDDTLPDVLASTYGADADRVAREYPRANYPSAALTYAETLANGTACTSREVNQVLAEQVPVFAFEFADRTAPGYVPLLAPYRPAGAAHASELSYLFDIRDKPINFDGEQVPLTDVQRELGDRMIRAWASFMHDGGGASWPPFDGTTALRFAPEGVSPVDIATEHRCALWPPAY